MSKLRLNTPVFASRGNDGKARLRSTTFIRGDLCATGITSDTRIGVETRRTRSKFDKKISAKYSRQPSHQSLPSAFVYVLKTYLREVSRMNIKIPSEDIISSTLQIARKLTTFPASVSQRGDSDPTSNTH